MSMVYKPSHQTQTGRFESNFPIFWLELGLNWEVFNKMIPEVDILQNMGDFSKHLRICSLTLILKLGPLHCSFGGYSSDSVVWKAPWLTRCTFKELEVILEESQKNIFPIKRALLPKLGPWEYNKIGWPLEIVLWCFF